MRITQGYISKSVADFPFHEIYILDDYMDTELPSVFFGCYRFEDMQMINSHEGHRTVFWTGQDILTYKSSGMKLKQAQHVTALPKVYELLKNEFDNVALINPPAFLNQVKPQELGTKIYAYCPSSMPVYHGIKIIEELRGMGYVIYVGDGRYNQKEWRDVKADMIYQGVFLGLCLSEFAGGGSSIIEMGLRGIPVITNVLNLPNCIPWVDAIYISNMIELYKSHIGTIQPGLARKVWESLDHEHKWLEL